MKTRSLAEETWVGQKLNRGHLSRHVGWSLITRWLPYLSSDERHWVSKFGLQKQIWCESCDFGRDRTRKPRRGRSNLLVKAETLPASPVRSRKSKAEPQSRWITYTPLLFYNAAGRRTRERTSSRLAKFLRPWIFLIFILRVLTIWISSVLPFTLPNAYLFSFSSSFSFFFFFFKSTTLVTSEQRGDRQADIKLSQ